MEVDRWDCSRLRLDGQTAVVAGAGALGRAFALGLAEAGADMVVADLRLAAAEEVAAEVESIGRKASALAVDVSKPDECKGMVDVALERLGRLDIMLNGVGINIRRSSLEVMEQDWDRVMAVNLKGAFFCAQAAARAFVTQGAGGKIITVASHLGIVGMGDRTAYSASKAGVVNMTRSLAYEWAKYRINVNGIAPCYTRTPINAETLDDPAFREMLVNRIPFRRLGQPEDLVGAAVYLASDASSFMTGQTLVIDGGWTTW